jgi:hypothetical protein
MLLKRRGGEELASRNGGTRDEKKSGSRSGPGDRAALALRRQRSLAMAESLKAADILTPDQLAKRLQVPLSWVYKKSVERGPKNMPVLRCGRYLRYDWQAVSVWLQTRNLP